MKQNLTVAVVGTANAGLTAAAHLSVRGFRVRLFDLPEFEATLAPIRSAGGITLEAHERTGLTGGFGKLEAVTTNAVEAVKGAQVVLAILPVYAHAQYAETLASALEPGQIVLLCPGTLWGVVEFAQVLKAQGTEGVVLAEAEALMYSSQKKDPTTMLVKGCKHALRVATLPARHLPTALPTLQQIFPHLEPAENVLETGISNPNCLWHVPLMVLNAGAVERSGGKFLFYHEGLTPGVARAIASLDAERQMLARRLGLQSVRSMLEQDLAWYGHQGASGDTILEVVQTNSLFSGANAPATLDHKYLTEDTAYGLVALEDLAQRIDLSTPTLSALIDLASALLGRNLRTEGRTSRRAGVVFETADELREIVNDTGL